MEASIFFFQAVVLGPIYNRLITFQTSPEQHTQATMEQFNIDTIRYDRMLFSVQTFTCIFEIIVNVSMMVMMFRHPRKTSQHELVLTVKRDLIYLVNQSRDSSQLVDQIDSLNGTMEMRRSHDRYSKHLDEMVDNQMRQIIGAILTLSQNETKT